MADEKPDEGAPPPPTFSALAMSLASQAMMSLGLMPEPGQKEPSKADLGKAQYLIDLLSMLEEKTKGNLDADEAKLMRDVLHDLRMAYVATSRKS